MAFTKKNFEENKALEARAADVLDDVGYNPADEDWHEDIPPRQRYHYKKVMEAVEIMKPEFPDVVESRIITRVNRIVMQRRGAYRRNNG